VQIYGADETDCTMVLNGDLMGFNGGLHDGFDGI
jgi:hypothetical protein